MRRTGKIVLLLLAALMSAVCLGARAETPFTGDPARIEAAAGSVVCVEVYDRGGNRISVASGFAAFDPPVLVTAQHAIVNMAWMEVIRDDGTRFRVDRLLDFDETADTVLCALPEDAGLTPLPVYTGPVPRGEDVAVISSRHGLINLVTKGSVCGHWTSQGIDWLLFSAPVTAGSSGGPVLNSRGEVIGLVMGAYDRGNGLNLAAPISVAAAMAE